MSTIVKPFAFVLMPFSKEFVDIYNLGIKQTCADLGVVAERVDEQQFSETILERIYRQISNCDFIIADMTGKNPNVFYEVGFAHSKEKLCILLGQKVEDIPFDLKHHSHIIYDGSVVDLKARLRPWLEWALDETKKRKAETVSLEIVAKDISLTKSKTAHVGKFDLEVSMKNNSSRRSPEIEAVYIHARAPWSLSANGKPCPFEKSDGDAGKIYVVSPGIKRLSPGAFSKETISFEKTFWSKYLGGEEKEDYKSSGNLKIEIQTDEGRLVYELPLEVHFEEFPF